MRKLIFIIFIFLVGCVACTKYPERLVDKNGVTLEPDSCYDYRVCMYYVVVGKLQSDCKLEFMKCCKDRDYIFCNDEYKRWEEDKPQNCWDKKQ
jgi:hypothetical protein